jgi:hypothetical protein
MSTNLTFEEIITGERFQALADVTLVTFSHSQVHTSCPPVNRIFYEQFYGLSDLKLKPLTSIFIYASNQQLFKTLVLPLIKVEIILLVHNGDDEFSDLDIIENPNIVHVLSQNCPVEHEKITHVPIGLANQMWPHGDLKTFYSIPESCHTPKSDSLYVNFGTSTFPSLREPLIKKIKSAAAIPDSNICLEEGKSFSQYLATMKNCQTVISPRGNGLDCHRTWEALYLGCKVICDKNPLSTIFKKMGLDIFLFEGLDYDSAYNEAQGVSSDVKNINKWLLLSTYKNIIDNYKSKSTTFDNC